MGEETMGVPNYFGVDGRDVGMGLDPLNQIQDATLEAGGGEPLITKFTKKSDGTVQIEGSQRLIDEALKALEFQKAAIAAVQAQELAKRNEIEANRSPGMALVNVLGTLGAQMSQGQDMPGWLQGLGRGAMIVAPPIGHLENEQVGLAQTIAKMSNALGDDYAKIQASIAQQETSKTNAANRAWYQEEMVRTREERLKTQRMTAADSMLKNVYANAHKGVAVNEETLRKQLSRIPGISDEEIEGHVAAAMGEANRIREHTKRIDDARVGLAEARKADVEEQTSLRKEFLQTRKDFNASYAKSVDMKGDQRMDSLARTLGDIEADMMKTQERVSALISQRDRELGAMEATRQLNAQYDKDGRYAQAIIETRKHWDERIAKVTTLAGEHYRELAKRKTEIQTKLNLEAAKAPAPAAGGGAGAAAAPPPAARPPLAKGQVYRSDWNAKSEARKKAWIQMNDGKEPVLVDDPPKKG